MSRDLPYRIEERGDAIVVDVEGGVVRSLNVVAAISAFGFGQLLAGFAPPFAPIFVVAGIVVALGMLGDAIRPPLLYIRPDGFEYRTLWPLVSCRYAWEDLVDAHLSGSTLKLALSDGGGRSFMLFTLPQEQRAWVEAEIRRRLGAPTGIDRLPGATTMDGLVVPIGVSKPDQRGRMVLAGAMSGGLGVLTAMVTTMAPGDARGLIGIGGIALAALGFFAWAIWSRSPEGLRIGTRDLAILRGGQVTWRRPFHEIEEVRHRIGEIAIQTTDGERRAFSILRLSKVDGAPEQLVRVLRDLAAEARANPDANQPPDPRLVALLQQSERER